MRRALGAVLLFCGTYAKPRRGSLFNAISPTKASSARQVTDVYDVGEVLDRYALALAATEPLREARDGSLRRSLGFGRFFWLTSVRKRNACDPRCRGSRVRGVSSRGAPGRGGCEGMRFGERRAPDA